MKGYIGWVNPTLCNLSAGYLAFSLEGITLCQDNTCYDWVQAGWQKRQSYDSSPKLLCEYGIDDVSYRWYWPMSAAQHAYQWDYASGWWTCRFDGSTKMSTSNLNWTQGDYVNAQGETNSDHTQIGANSPSTNGLHTLRWRRVVNITWYSYVLTMHPVSAPYGRSLPAPDFLSNWTNVPH